MLKANSQPPKALKFHYRTNTNSSSRCTPSASECVSSRKDSRVRGKRGKNQNDKFGQRSHLVSHKRGLSEFKDTNRMTPNSMVMGTKDSSTLREKNVLLDACIQKQGDEIDQLRRQIASMKMEVEDTLETKRSKETNNALKEKYNAQNREIEQLKSQIGELKKMLSQGMSTASEEQVESRVDAAPTQLSRRLEVFSKYEQLTVGIGEKEASRVIDQLEQIRLKYQDELRGLTEEVSRLKQRELLVDVLEEQIRNKNETIDFLRRELQQMESSSQRLLGAVSSLEERMDSQSRRGAHTVRPWGKDDSFHSFSGYC